MQVASGEDNIFQEVFRITPILTVLKTEGMSQSSAQLVCTKMIEGFDDDAPGLADDEGARYSYSMPGLVIACLLFMLNWL